MTNFKTLGFVAIAATMVTFGAQAQNKTVNVYANTPNGAGAVLANMGHTTTSAGGYGTGVNANASISKTMSPGFTGKFANSGASADSGTVMANTTTKLGSADSGASGQGVSAWTSGGKTTDSTGTTKSLNSSGWADQGGAWAAVSGGWGSALSVGSGQNVNVNAGYSTSPATTSGGGGKG